MPIRAGSQKLFGKDVSAQSVLNPCLEVSDAYRLAYAEIRLLMANLLFHFDIELVPEDHGWIDRCRVFLGWEKPVLRAIVKERSAS